MLIEKRLDSTANQQEEFLEKLETVIQDRWKEEGAKIYVEERDKPFWSKLSYDKIQMSYDVARNKYLKVKRKQSSIFIEVEFRKTVVNTEKSSNDLLVFSEGFYVFRLAKIVWAMMLFAVGFILIVPWIFWLIAPSPPTQLIDIIDGILLILSLYAIILSLVFYRGKKGLSILAGKAGIWSKGTQKVLDIFLKKSIEETINLLK